MVSDSESICLVWLLTKCGKKKIRFSWKPGDNCALNYETLWFFQIPKSKSSFSISSEELKVKLSVMKSEMRNQAIELRNVPRLDLRDLLVPSWARAETQLKEPKTRNKKKKQNGVSIFICRVSDSLLTTISDMNQSHFQRFGFGRDPNPVRV